MKVAIEGCSHGELDKIYATLKDAEQASGEKIDLLLCCGDFQAMRSPPDLDGMACPIKYRAMGDFYRYYTGEKIAPVLTLVIGGNHESSAYLWELFHGGWLAPNIYYLGHAGSVIVDDWLRIAGSSGIYKDNDYFRGMGYSETLPYNHGSMRSAYHTREFNILKLMQLNSKTAMGRNNHLDILLSHDWPQAIERFGDLPGLIRRKQHFRSDIETNSLGSPPLLRVLRFLQPSYMFSGHMHVHFPAFVKHDEADLVLQKLSLRYPLYKKFALPTKVVNPDEIEIDDDLEDGNNPDEIVIDEDDEEPVKNSVAAKTTTSSFDLEKVTMEETPIFPAKTGRTTKFLALDKPGNRGGFFQVVDIPVPEGRALLSRLPGSHPTLAFDPMWLAITRAFNPYFSLQREQHPRLPRNQDYIQTLVQKEWEWVWNNLLDQKEETSLRITDFQTFVKTAPALGEPGVSAGIAAKTYRNPQTAAFCKMLDIPFLINANGENN